MRAYFHCMKNFVNFNGRLGRRDFAIFYLMNLGISVSLAMTEIFTEIGYPLLSIFSLATLLPVMAASARRLHDIDRKAWWVIVSFIPVVGMALVAWILLAKGSPGPNRFGDPVAI